MPKTDKDKAFDKFYNLDYRAQAYLRAAAVQTLVKEGIEINKTNIENKLYARWTENGESWSQKKCIDL